MALQAGRVGVSPLEVDERGKLNVNADVASVRKNVESIGDVISSDKWNQLIAPFMYPTSTASGISRTVSGNAITLAGTASADAYISIVDLAGITKGHKFFIKLNELGSGAVPEVYIGNSSTVGTTGIELSEENIIEIPSDYASTITGIYMKAVNTKVYNSTFMPIMTDLTELYGSGNEPTSVAEFRKIFSHDYYGFKQAGFADLLWTNESPTADFPTQTVSLDLSNYSNILVFYALGSYYASVQTITPIGEKSTAMLVSYENTNLSLFSRDITSLNSTGITFSGCTYMDQGYPPQQVNNYLVPYKIYGIR